MIVNLIFLLFLFCTCKSAYIDTLDKCHLHDDDCGKNSLEKIIKDLSKTGLPEYDIPPLDPLHLKDVSVSISNILDLTLLDGVVKGFKNCLINKYSINVESGRSHLDVYCDLTVKGRYRVTSSGDAVKTLFGAESLHGEGNGKVKIEKVHIIFDFAFLLKNRNGDIYIVDKPEKQRYSYDIEGKMLFAADNLYLGNVESSKIITDFLNQNWKSLFEVFGSSIMDKTMELLHKYVNNFYKNVPTRYFMLDDLSPFLTN